MCRSFSKGSVLAVLTIGALSRIAFAADEDLLREQIAAGEFAPAIRQAAGADAADRDQLFGQIAAGQAQAGDRRAALSTASGIGNDLFRTQSLSGIASQPVGGQGGMGGNVQPDFTSLIDLITTTVAPPSWEEVGGPGTIDRYRNGVHVDAWGVLASIEQEQAGGELDELWRLARPTASADVRRDSPLRKVSLPRLEKAVQLRLAAGLPLEPEMLALAGLQRVKYVLVYPESGDIVLAGPAGDWQPDAEGNLVGVASGHPVLQLDDLVVLLRHMRDEPGVELGCSINPRAEGLAQAQAAGQKPIKSGRRGEWLKGLQKALGSQDIEVYGVDPGTRVAQVMVAADYHMKRVGIGLEEGTLGVPSYLASIEVPKGQAPPPLGVLRWWFTLNYRGVKASADRQAYQFNGQGVKVLSENEMLAKNGEQIHTGKAELLNQQFAQNFTKHFEALATKYSVYADLQNVFDLALAAALVQSEDLSGRVNWHMPCFGDPAQYQVAFHPAPRSVQSVINHRVINRVHVVAAVSGGVSANFASLVTSKAIEVERSKGEIDSEHVRSTPPAVQAGSWWWD